MESSMKFLLIVFLITLSCNAAGSELRQSVPPRFQGEWNVDLRACGSGDNDSALGIAANRIEFWESSGPIKAVVTSGEFDMAIISELSGEGETWLSYTHFRLSGNHNNLIDVTNGGKFVRQRCPAKKNVPRQ